MDRLLSGNFMISARPDPAKTHDKHSCRYQTQLIAAQIYINFVFPITAHSLWPPLLHQSPSSLELGIRWYLLGKYFLSTRSAYLLTNSSRMNVAAGPELAAAVTNAGGLGVIGGVGYTPKVLRQQVCTLSVPLSPQHHPTVVLCTNGQALLCEMCLPLASWNKTVTSPSLTSQSARSGAKKEVGASVGWSRFSSLITDQSDQGGSCRQECAIRCRPTTAPSRRKC